MVQHTAREKISRMVDSLNVIKTFLSLPIAYYVTSLTFCNKPNFVFCYDNFSHQLRDTCFFQMNYYLFLFHVFLLVFAFFSLSVSK